MSRVGRKYQVSLLVDLAGGSPFRMATLRCALAARDSCSSSGIDLELLVNVDPEDSLVDQCLSDLPKEARLAMRVADTVAEGCLSPKWVGQARGELITLLQAPDLVSANWLGEAIRTYDAARARGDSRVIVRPEQTLFPDLEPRHALILEEGETPDSATAFAMNPFGLLFLAPRALLEELPMGEASFQGDCPVWTWACDTLSAGVAHLPAPRTSHVIRTAARSVRSGCLGASSDCVPGASRLQCRSNVSARASAETKIEPPRALAEELREIAPDLEHGIEGEWRSLGPSEAALESARVFRAVFDQLPVPLDFLVVQHFLSVGGSEKETLASLSAIQELRPSLSMAVMTTEARHSCWANRVPRGIPVVELGILSRSLSFEAQKVLLFRVFRQLRPKVINNVISPLCWEVFADHAGELARVSKLIATEFCVNRNLKGDLESFAYSHLPLCWEHVSLLLADNQHLIDDLSDKFGFDRSCAVLYGADVPIRKIDQRGYPSGVLRAVWAGRFTRQKRPDILLQIVDRCPEFEFHVFCTNPDTREAMDTLEALHCFPNVKIRDPFKRFDELPPEGYDAFLYTSSWDGMPNVILEAIASGLPVIAPAVGGVPEMICGETGYLVSDPEAIDEFVAFLHSIALDPAEAQVRAKRAQRELVLQRNRKMFLATWSGLLERILGRKEVVRHATPPAS